MPTRRQDPASWQFRQDAFASSADFEQGILGNLVATRCQKLTDPEVISMLWWLQQVSWRTGGLEKLAADFLQANSHLIGTPSMHRFGMNAGQVYTAEQVRAIRRELPGCGLGRFPLRGEQTLAMRTQVEVRMQASSITSDYEEELRHEAERLPKAYPAARLLEACKIEPDLLAKELKQWLLDPSTQPTKDPWNIAGLWNALRQWRDSEATQSIQKIIETEVTRRVFDELDFALEQKTFVLIEGREGIGKSEAAALWCRKHPGQAIYIRMEVGSDETTLYRSIARKVGTACSYRRKAVEMRARIEDALQPGHLMLVIDEAHFLWPQSDRSSRSAPKRLDWLRTALVDFGVPVALISTPQYFEQACTRFREAGWNSLQLQRRIARTLTLPAPEELPLADVLNVAKSYFPRANESTLKKIAALALANVGFLTAIKHLRQRVDFLRSRNPGASESETLAGALREAGLPAVETAVDSASPAVLKGGLNRLQRPLSGDPVSRAESTGRLIVSPVLSAT